MCSQSHMELSSNRKLEMGTGGGVWLSEEQKESFLRLHTEKINVAVMDTRLMLFLSQIVNIFFPKRSSKGCTDS